MRVVTSGRRRGGGFHSEAWFPVRRRCPLVHWAFVCLLVWLAPYLVAAQRSDHDTALLDPLPAPVSARLVRARPVQGGNSLQNTADPGGAGVGERAVEGPLEDPLQQLNLEEGSGGGEQDPEEVVSQQFEGPRREPGVLECDFGSGDRSVSLCDYSNSNITVLRWQASTGRSSNWLGGPPTDSTGSQDGGYVFFETSELPDDDVLRVNSESAMLESGLQPRTPPAGQCVQFAYHREGLSAGELRVLLHPVSDAELLGYPADHSGDTVLAHSSADVAGAWSSAEMIYTYPGQHTIVFEAIPCRSRRVGSCSPDYRGHIAVDSVRLAPDGCLGHCTFDGGACGWTQDNSDDFQWELSRGSLSRDTGPRADHGSELFGSTSGGYMFASSAFPRRPGDRARLLSPQLSAGQPRCFRFWLYLFGPGVGTLRVLLLAGDRRQELWRLSGPAGQQWHQGLVTVSAEAGTFRLALEAELGTERLGDIAVDDVSLENGICPAAPQTAAPWSSGCTFEVDTCGWAGVEGDRGLWERVVAAATDGVPATDHTTGRPGGGLVRLGPADPPPPGHVARLLSPRLDRPDAAATACLTFRYYMDQGVVGSSGGRLGGLRVWTERDSPQRERQLIWRLVNAQGAGWRLARAPIQNADGVQLELEGSWAAGAGRHGVIAVDDIVLLDGDCAPAPPQSRPAAGDCDFTHDACGWSNSTTDERRQQRWRLAAPLAAQAPRILLTDHTFRDAGGYIYFDLFSPQDRREQLRMVSPLLEPAATGGGAGACVAFWLAHLSPSEPTQLRVLLEVVTSGVGDEAQFGEPTVLWSVRASETGARRLTWLYGQAGFRATQSYRVTFEGDASKYGFALDDITFTSGDCEVRPSNAAPNEGAREQRSLIR